MNEKKTLDLLKIEKTAISLKKNNFAVEICETKQDALNLLTDMIDSNASIGFGGSRSLEEIGFFDVFTPEKYPNFLNRKKKDMTPEEKVTIQHKSLTADYFLASANAISQTGEIIMIDMWGNRNGAMTYGPSKRIFIVGKNKIAQDLNTALERAQDTAAVLNNIRFDTKNPCTTNGKCMDCNSTGRLCNITTIIQKCLPVQSILVLLINEELGF